MTSFEDVFGRPPAGTWAAPGRVNLIGDHTDYNRGLALPFAIDRRCSVTVAGRPDNTVRCWSRQLGTGDEVSLDTLPTGIGWPGYVAGVLWALRDAGHPVLGLDVLVDSTVPAGAGLSSSAAVECAVAVAAAEVFALGVTDLDLVHAAHRAETEVVGAPVGLLDQMASLLCRRGMGLLIDFAAASYRPVDLRPSLAATELVVFDSGVRHAHADGGYADRRRECEEAATLLGVGSLRDVGGEATAPTPPVLPDPLARRVRHVVTENERVAAVAAALERGDAQEVGRLMTASHTSLRDDFDVSVAAVDTIVAAAVSGGAYGARMTGGGFGGSVVALVSTPLRDSVVSAVTEAAQTHGFPTPRALSVHPAGGAGRVR